MKRILYILFVLAFSISGRAQVTVEQQIDSVAILIGEQTGMTVSVSMPRKSSLVWPEIAPRTYLTPGVEIINVGDADTSALDNDFVKVSRTLTLTSFDESLYAIPPIVVNVDGKEYSGKTLALKVLTVEVDTLHPNQFFPPKDVQDNPFSWDDWKNVFRMSLLMVVLIMLLCYLYVRLKQNKPIISLVRIVKHVPPHQKAMSAIEKIKEDKMVYSDDQKTYYTRLTDTLRQYIEERFGFNAKEMTTGEIISRLQAEDDPHMIEELRDLFATADLVKFAKYSTLVNENDLNLVNAIKFIDDTKIEGQVVEERIVPQLSSADKRRQANRSITKLLIGILIVAIICFLVYLVITIYNI